MNVLSSPADTRPERPSAALAAARPEHRSIVLREEDRDQRLAELAEQLSSRHRVRGRLRRLRKKYLWSATIGLARLTKRAIDLGGAGVGLVLAAPLFVVIAAVIKLQDSGPVLFWQTRVGQWGREFSFPKFRSMHLDAEARKAELMSLNEHAEGITFKIRCDPRITPAGRVLRKLSLDELPQLWCVLKGEMSLVGPRPPVPSEVAQYTLADRRRLDARPGLTCIWQVSGRGDIPFPQQVRLDVEYIESQSLWLDLKLIAATVPAVLLGRGAY